MIKTIVVGPRGKMGRLITQIAADSKELELIAGVGAKDRDYIGQDLGQTALLGRNLGVFVVDNLEEVIDEMHDRWKKDAPSGTSKEIGELIAHELGAELSNLAIYGREGTGERGKGTIGYHSVRMGDTPSSHTVFFGGFGERLEISHHSTDWRGFAKGACDCALFLAKQPPGNYSVSDVLKI